ncbi:MAG: ferrochelatase [Desulfobulbus propionicus]|nr:MAG: ferrochelatase [Desulfobulbus propionicus]
MNKHTSQKIGVLLLNLGGPECPEDVEPFLRNLFSDRHIIRLGPRLLQKPIAWMIARKRAPKSMENYRKIGGGSPLLRITRLQADCLAEALTGAGNFLVRVCMRYWHPMAAEVLDELQEAGVERLVILPLYPQYSIATTGSSFFDLEETLKKKGWSVPVTWIHDWPDEPGYIQALAQRVEEGLADFSQPPALLYSAHSLPVRFIDEGDPYVEHLQRTITALETVTGHPGQLCYQSRSGPVEWLGPSTPETIQALITNNRRGVLVVPLSFVSDHVETLYEIDVEYREMAEQAGLTFACTKGLNDLPLFIKALRSLVLRYLNGAAGSSPGSTP